MSDDHLDQFLGIASCPVCGCLERRGTYRCPECGTFHAGSIMEDREAPPPNQEIDFSKLVEIDVDSIPSSTVEPKSELLTTVSSIDNLETNATEYLTTNSSTDLETDLTTNEALPEVSKLTNITTN